MSKIFIALFFMCALGAPRAGQTQILSQRIQWNSAHVSDLSTQESRSLSSQFISDGNKLTWNQNGNVTYEFTITQTDGNWENTASDGTLTLTITLNQRSSTAVLAREDGNLSITMTIPGQGESTKTYKFIVDTLEIL